MRASLFCKVLPIYVLVGFMFALPIWQRHEASAAALQAAKAAQSQLNSSRPVRPVSIEGTPVRIVMPTQGIDLSVVTGSYSPKASSWSVTGYTANYAGNTAPANNKHGKTFIYGHWTKRVFGNTKGLVPGDMAYVYTDNGHVFQYRYVSKKVVAPSQVQVLRELGGRPGLVVMTCEGAWAQDRRLMYFNLAASS